VTPAKTWAPGVAKGDFCYYETYGVYTSNAADARIWVPEFEQNNTEWVRVDVTEVSGSIIHQLYTLYFWNGTEETFEKETNVNPDVLNTLSFSQKGIPLCAANLDAGDPFPTANLTVNDTRVVNCLGAEREAVHLSWSTPEDWGDCYLDRKTGVLVELCRIHAFTNPATGETIEKTDVVKLTNTNLWTPNNSPNAAQEVRLEILAAFCVILPIAGIARHKSKKEAKRGK
jgi:hypothetical protein